MHAEDNACSRGILFSVFWKAHSRLSDAVAQWRELFVHRPMHLTKLSPSGPILELVDVDLEVYELIWHARKFFPSWLYRFGNPKMFFTVDHLPLIFLLPCYPARLLHRWLTTSPVTCVPLVKNMKFLVHHAEWSSAVPIGQSQSKLLWSFDSQEHVVWSS